MDLFQEVTVTKALEPLVDEVKLALKYTVATIRRGEKNELENPNR